MDVDAGNKDRFGRKILGVIYTNGKKVFEETEQKNTKRRISDAF